MQSKTFAVVATAKAVAVVLVVNGREAEYCVVTTQYPSPSGWERTTTDLVRRRTEETLKRFLIEEQGGEQWLAPFMGQGASVVMTEETKALLLSRPETAYLGNFHVTTGVAPRGNILEQARAIALVAHESDRREAEALWVEEA